MCVCLLINYQIKFFFSIKAGINSESILDELVGSNRAMVASNTLNNDDLALVRSIENLFDDKKKFNEFVSLLGENDCYQNLITDMRFESLVSTISKISSPSSVMNDQKKMNEVISYINSNECLKALFNDKTKVQKLSALLGDTKVLLTLQTLMNSTGNRIPKIIEYINTDRAINQQLSGNQIGQVVDIFGYSCIQSLIKDKNKVNALMAMISSTSNPASIMADSKKSGELLAIFDGTDCLTRIMADKSKMQALTNFLSDTKNLQTMQATIKLWSSGQMRRKRQLYSGKSVVPNDIKNFFTITKAMETVNSGVKNLPNGKANLEQKYPQIFQELMRNKTMLTNKEIQALYNTMNNNNNNNLGSNSYNSQQFPNIPDTNNNKAYGADSWNSQIGKQSWNPMGDQNWNNQMGSQNGNIPMSNQNWENQIGKQPWNVNANQNPNSMTDQNRDNQIGKLPWKNDGNQNWDNQIGKNPWPNNGNQNSIPFANINWNR